MTASITEGVQDLTVATGEQVKFACSAVGSEVEIQWTINDTECEICSPGRDTDTCFENSYMNDTVTTRSILIITDSSSLGVGSYTVQCIVQQNLDPGFETDLFQESRTASLHVQGEAPTSCLSSLPLSL